MRFALGLLLGALIGYLVRDTQPAPTPEQDVTFGPVRERRTRKETT